jgi:hypothetical protein
VIAGTLYKPPKRKAAVGGCAIPNKIEVIPIAMTVDLRDTGSIRLTLTG